MKSTRVRLVAVAALACLASFVAVAPLAAQPGPIDLGSLGGTQTHAAAINNRQQVVGWSLLAGSTERHAFLWEDGVMHDLGGSSSSASAINDRGQVVGIAAGPEGVTLPMLWENGQATVLPTLAASVVGCYPTGINQHGVIVGWCPVPVEDGFFSQAVMVRWVDGVIEPLLPMDVEAFPTAINDRGAIIGYAFSPPRSNLFFFLWQDGVLSRVDQLTAQPFEDVTGINAHGDLAGYRLGPQGAQAIVWDGRTIVALPGLPGAGSSFASAINDHGEVAGVSAGGLGHNFPVVWTRKGIVVLGTVPAQFIQPTAINDRGDVIGEATLSGDAVTGLLWPSTTHGH